MSKFIKWLAGLACFPWICFALTYTLPPAGDDIVGDLQRAEVEPGDNFNTLGHRYDVGYYELIEANPGVNPDHPKSWNKIIVPTRKILPPGPRTGLVVNLAEMRLYYYLPHSHEVLIYPVGIGREGWLSPRCSTTVKAKEKNPTWNVPASIRADRAKEGVYLPKMVLPGPENPLGDRAMRLAMAGGTYLIHGTNDPDGIGRRSSSGCIRMMPDDVRKLYDYVPVGTPVRIISEAVKVGWHDGQLYIESHVPLQEQTPNGYAYTPMVKLVMNATKGRPVNIDWGKAKEITDAQMGVPQSITGSNDYIASNSPPPELSSHDVVITARSDVPKEVERDDTPIADNSFLNPPASEEDSSNIIEALEEA